MNFDVQKIFQERLAFSLGLDKYQYIINQVKKTNVSCNIEFQRIFNGFYRVRRNEKWRDIYYKYFEQVKNANPTFESILVYLYKTTGNIEPSFSSKMLATIFPNKPIWDNHVVNALNLKLVGVNEERLQNAITLYSNIEKWYEDFLQSYKGKECIEVFNKTLPNYKNITNVKKIDCVLWSIK